jgi:hypothetical protein
MAGKSSYTHRFYVFEDNLLCTWFPKKTDLGGLVAIIAVSVR